MLLKNLTRNRINKVSRFFRKMQNKKEEVKEEMTFPLFLKRILNNQSFYALTPEGIHATGANSDATLIQVIQKRYSQKKIKLWYHSVSRKVVLDFYAGPIADEGKELMTKRPKKISLDMSIKKVRREFKKWFLSNELVFGYKIKTSFIEKNRHEDVRYERGTGGALAKEIAIAIYSQMTFGKKQKDLDMLMRKYSNLSEVKEVMYCRVVSLAKDSKDPVASEMMKIDIANNFHDLVMKQKRKSWFGLQMRGLVLKLRYIFYISKPLPTFTAKAE